MILVPGPVIEPVSPALEGGFLTTGSPGKSQRELSMEGLNYFVLVFFFFSSFSHKMLNPRLLTPGESYQKAEKQNLGKQY